MDTLLSTGDIATLVKVSPRRVTAWVERGLLNPTTPSMGPGQYRGFDAIQLGVAIALANLDGIDRKLVHRVMAEQLQQHLERNEPFHARTRYADLIVNLPAIRKDAHRACDLFVMAD